MITEIEGNGKQHGIEQQVRGKTYKIPLMTKARIELVVKDKDVKVLVDAIRNAACTDKVGDGKIFISPVDEVYTVSSGIKETSGGTEEVRI